MNKTQTNHFFLHLHIFFSHLHTFHISKNNLCNILDYVIQKSFFKFVISFPIT